MKQHEILNHYFKIKKKKQTCFCVEVQTDEKLKVLGLYYIHVTNTKKLPSNWCNRSRHYLSKQEFSKMIIGGLGMPYYPAAELPVKSLNTTVPDSMGYEVHSALHRLKQAVGDVNEYVRINMHYQTQLELAEALSAEQVDAVAMAVYNIEERQEATIIGDQTGIGKGRIAAALIRIYAIKGYKPFFLTEKPNLFSDMYRDLKAIGSANLKPFIVNNKDDKTTIQDEEGNKIYEPYPRQIQENYFSKGTIPKECSFVMATYSQFASLKPTSKQDFLLQLSQDNIFILDESHVAGGDMEVSATARFFNKVVQNAHGGLFLSATFAKRPDNMPLYAAKSCMGEAALSNDGLIYAIQRGGVALQEVISSILVGEGQMIRRERSFEGINVNYIYLDKEGKENFGVEDLKTKHWEIADKITDILRNIIYFELTYINPFIDQMNDALKAEMTEVQKRKGTNSLGIKHTPYFSKLFNIVNQMLFSIKAEAATYRAIQRLKEGKKPVIAFASTMGAFLSDMENDHGLPVSDGDLINAEFSNVLKKGLESVFAITEIDSMGKRIKRKIELHSLGEQAIAEYYAITRKIKKISTGLSISPIDNVKSILEREGYKCAEVTGRNLEVQFPSPDKLTGIVRRRKKENVVNAFRKFNNNEVDVLLLNQSGSTGASAHAISTPKVPIEKVKKRVMIMLQAEGDINLEMQKRGRVNRTGQIYKPDYDYVTSAIPAELRLMMMLQRKLKSLDANTTSNQKQSKAMLESPDFLNKYGDSVVLTYLVENPKINEILGDPANLSDTEQPVPENLASKVSGRVAILPCKEQQIFYETIIENYNVHVNYLKQTGYYDLEMENLNLQANVLEKNIVFFGKGGRSAFGGDTFLERIEANVLKKPYHKEEVESMINDVLQGEAPGEYSANLISKTKNYFNARFENETKEIEEYIENLISNIPKEKKYQTATNKSQYIKQRTWELQDSKEERIKLLKNKLSSEAHNLCRIFKDLYPGKSIVWQSVSGEGLVDVPAVFIGFKLNYNRPNPFAPSAVLCRITIADSTKYVELVLSGEQGIKINSIIYASNDVSGYLESWEDIIMRNNISRSQRFVFTGNILQAFGKIKGGKLISYTSSDQKVTKGILMPEHWTPKLGKIDHRTVPLKFCLKAIINQSRGSFFKTDNLLTFSMRNGNMVINTNGLALNKYDWLIKNEGILQYIIEEGGFQKKTSTWQGSVSYQDIQTVLDIIYEISHANGLLTEAMIELVKDDIPKNEVKEKEQIDLSYLKQKDSSADLEKRKRIAKVKAVAKLKYLNLLQV